MESINVSGMHCRSCKMLIEEALDAEGFSDVSIELDEKNQNAVVSFTGSKKKAVEIIEREGYQVKY